MMLHFGALAVSCEEVDGPGEHAHQRTQVLHYSITSYLVCLQHPNIKSQNLQAQFLNADVCYCTSFHAWACVWDV